MNDCIICYDEGINLIKPIDCNCIVFMHNDCFVEMKNKLNITCPICRKKTNENVFNLNNIRIIEVEIQFPWNMLKIIYCLGITIILFFILLSYLILFVFKNSLIIFPCFFIYYIIF